MYVLIDRDRMIVLHTHESVTTLCDLATIEAPDATYYILPIDDAIGFKQFTDMELTILYRNLTGVDHSIKGRLASLQVIFNLIRRVKPTSVNAGELDKQAEHALANPSFKWLYVKGANRPAKKADLFEPACQRATKCEDEEAAAIAGKTPALTPVKTALPLPTREDRPLPSVTPKGNGPKRGTAKAIIWSTADRLWAEAGEPKVQSEVLALRKLIMDELEKEGIKRLSASSELGNWQKTRVTN